MEKEGIFAPVVEYSLREPVIHHMKEGNTMSNMKARFQKIGNAKIGRMWNFSTLMGDESVRIDFGSLHTDVVGTCGKYCEGCKKDCYVRASYRYPSVKFGHARNTLALREDVKAVFNDLDGELRRARKKPEFVRIHVSGEFETWHELNMWNVLALLHPDVTFYVYSKAYDIIGGYLQRGNINPNLIINVSIWHDFGIEFFNHWKHLPNVRAFVYDDGFNYGAAGIVGDSRCPAYDKDGKTVDGVTCDKCQLCAGKRGKKITFCPAH
jgi:hypothetical protein